jgi:hypothetical protein
MPHALWRVARSYDVLGPCTALFGLLMLLGLSGLKVSKTRCAGQSPSAPIEESCADTRIDTEEGNITHGPNATPRAWTSLVSQFIGQRVCGSGNVGWD